MGTTERQKLQDPFLRDQIADFAGILFKNIELGRSCLL